jgi:hypothetical protein
LLSIVPVVEGPGDVQAFPVLLRKILYERISRYDIQIGNPKNGNGRGNLLKRFENYLEYAAIEPRCGAILVLIDSDDDCPVNLAKNLADRCAAVATGKPTVIVCAAREYESWILASLSTVKGNSGISEVASLTGDTETFKGVKGWLTNQMPLGRAYKETLHQAALTNWIDLNLAHDNSRSFRRLCHAVQELIDSLDNGSGIITPHI